YCTGARDQPPPSCPARCVDDGECIDAAHCEVGVCAPDRPAGGGCSRPGECASGLSCVDGRCCDTACSGTCEACNLPSVEGTCTPIMGGSDPAGECPALSCAAYYAGFDMGGRCFRRADVPDSSAACNGGGACLDAAALCPAQPAGPLQISCDPLCERPSTGTCTGTT